MRIRLALRSLVLVAALAARSTAGEGASAPVGPEVPPGFYGSLPDAFPGLDAPEGIRRLALVYSSNLVGETDPCG